MTSRLPSLARLDREIGLRGSLYDFVRIAWHVLEPGPFVDGWHIRLICDALERCYRGELRNVAFNIPPACMKSMLVAVFWPVWCWLQEPSLQFFATAYDVTLSYRDSGRALRLVQSEWFRERWGDRVAIHPSAGVGDHTNAAGGGRISTSVNRRGTGRHPDVMLIDDPIKAQEVTPAALAHVEEYWNKVLRSRAKNPKTIRRVLIMQRLAVRDLAGVLAEEGDWHFIVLPMRYELDGAYSDDPRRAAGELLWPERFGEAEVRQLERMPLRDRAAQLQQRPVPDGGAIIKRSWIRWYDPAKPPRFSQRVQSWDLTFKDTSGSHFVAGQLWGVDGPNFYFIDGVLERLDFVASLEAILRMCAANPGSSVLIEDKANGPAVMAMLAGKVPGVVPVEPCGGKDARLNAVSPLFEGGNVWLPLGHPVAETLAASLVAFPAGAQDDDVDACTQVLNYLHAQVVDYGAAMAGLRGGMF